MAIRSAPAQPEQRGGAGGMKIGVLAVVFSATILGIMPSMQKQLMMD